MEEQEEEKDVIWGIWRKLNILDSKFDKLQEDMSERQCENHAVYHDEVYDECKKDIVDEMEGILLDNK